MMGRRRKVVIDVQSEAPIVNGDCGDQNSAIDRISLLPDELLVFILSLLPLKESAATSLLSQRWRYLWTLSTRLHFDDFKSLLKVDIAHDWGSTREEGRSNYIRWVDNTIALCKMSDLEEFRVHFNLDRTSEKYIDRWVEYALARKVKWLELELVDDGDSRFPRPYDECYTFPYRCLFKGKEYFKYLEKLRMNHVNVSSEALEFFLRNCPLLQHLSVSGSGELRTLRIIGPSPPLKYLEIQWCENLASLEIRDASDLVFLKYEAYADSLQHLVLKNVPLLVGVSIGGRFTRKLRDVMVMFSGVLPQLAKLNISGGNLATLGTEMLHSAVTMSGVKQLFLNASGGSLRSLRPITYVSRACPCLEILVLEALSMGMVIEERKMERRAVDSHARLKEVRFVGFRGFVSELELMLDLAESCEALEKMVIDPCFRCCTPYIYYRKHNHSESKEEHTQEEAVARKRAHKYLAPNLPSRVCLQIL